MRLMGLAARNITRNGFRSLVVAACVFVVTGSTLLATMILRGAEDDLRLESERLGADLVVLPKGSDAQPEGALFLGGPSTARMPESVTQKIAQVPGVAAVSPQLFLASVSGAASPADPETFLVAFDPSTDFTVRPWLRSPGEGSLKLGECFVGSQLSVPGGDGVLRTFGPELTMKARLEPTGTSLDQTVFVSFDTARGMARASGSEGAALSGMPPGFVSAVLVKLTPKVDPTLVAMVIDNDLTGVSAVKGAELFRSVRSQLTGMVVGFVVVLAILWGISVLVTGLVFSVAVNQRRREIAVLRALGATRFFVLRSLLAEVLLLALLGGLAGSSLAGACLYLFRDLLVDLLRISFLVPPLPDFLALTVFGLALGLVSVIMAALFPANKASRQDPAQAMRE